MVDKRYGAVVTGFCLICKYEGYTEMHHIISQDRCKRIGKPELINNSGNVVELCLECHDNTTASLIAKNDIIIQTRNLESLEERKTRYLMGGYVPVSEIISEEVNVFSGLDEKGKPVFGMKVTQYSQALNRRGSQRAIVFHDWANIKEK